MSKNDINAITNTTPAFGEQILPVELSKIHVDYAWNCRAERRIQDVSDSEPGSMGFEGFGASIRTSGQITPVILRNTGGKTLLGAKTDKPYELVVGFRRMRAITMLNTTGELDRAGRDKVIPNLPNGTILAVIREISGTAARILNGQENTQRANLKAPDLVYLCRDLEKDGLTQQAIGDSLGITQGWVSRMLKISKLPPAIVSNWRDGTPIPAVTTKDGTFEIKKGDAQTEMTEPNIRALADLKGSPEEVTARYIRLVRPPVAQGEGDGAPVAEKDKVREEVEYIAGLMGCMVRVGVLDSGNLDWNRVIGPKKKGYPIDCGKDDSADRLIELADVAQDAYEREVSKGARGKEGATAQSDGRSTTTAS